MPPTTRRALARRSVTVAISSALSCAVVGASDAATGNEMGNVGMECEAECEWSEGTCH